MVTCCTKKGERKVLFSVSGHLDVVVATFLTRKGGREGGRTDGSLGNSHNQSIGRTTVSRFFIWYSAFSTVHQRERWREHQQVKDENNS